MRLGANSSLVSGNPRFGEQFILRKESPGTRVNGRFVPGTIEDIPLRGNVQPITPDIRNNEEGGERLREGILVTIKTDNRDLIRPMRQGNTVQTRPDKIVVDNLEYLAYEIENFSTHGHLEVICIREENQSD